MGRAGNERGLWKSQTSHLSSGCGERRPTSKHGSISFSLTLVHILQAADRRDEPTTDGPSAVSARPVGGVARRGDVQDGASRRRSRLRAPGEGVERGRRC
ncbi:hypothetical protein LSAT2_031137 [Lamellibrachia satsuma]|nr:hypothetical protein LSAT2_031137 [Lamellibrachia satsuma]